MPYKDKNKQNEYQLTRRNKIKNEYFKNKSCFMCGSTKNLELDHRDPTQKEHHVIWSWSKERRDIELAKCDPLCHDCHKLKTLLMDLVLAEHGTQSGYAAKCRCQDCKKAHAQSNMHYRCR